MKRLAMVLAVVAMGALNAEERYTAPALASSMFNIVAIIGGAVVYFVAPGPRAAVIAWAALAVVGGIAQLGIQIPTLWRMGFRPKLLPDLRLRDPGTRRIAALMAAEHAATERRRGLARRWGIYVPLAVFAIAVLWLAIMLVRRPWG